MQNDVKQVYHFHADANALGGFFEGPFRHIPGPASVSLSSTGGAVRSQKDQFGFEDLISCRSSYTHVSGKPTKTNGPWISRTTAVVEGLNILGKITAERVAARLYTEHPSAGGGGRRITFAGARYDDLRIDGKPVVLSLHNELLPKHLHGSDAYDEDESLTADIEWPTLWRTAHTQALAFRDNQDTPQWARERYGWGVDQQNPERARPEGYAVCSLVEKIDGLPSGQTAGHCIDLPGVGRIFLGETTIFPHSVHLTMIRAELGCKVSGQTGVASARTNGSTYPPG